MSASKAYIPNPMTTSSTVEPSLESRNIVHKAPGSAFASSRQAHAGPSPLSSTVPLGARPPRMIRRGSRFDPMSKQDDAEDDLYEDLGPRHPLRKIREDTQPERNEGVSLPGIKALLNAADQPPLVSPFAPSFFSSSPSVNSGTSAPSPLDSPTSRTSRVSSFTSSLVQDQGWWAPDEPRSGPSSGGPSQTTSRSNSFARALDSEPDYKRRRSDLPPALPDADEVARLKWQAQSRNASYPATVGGGNPASGPGLRAMLYPPPSSSASHSRGSISGAPLGSPLTPPIESPFQSSSVRGSPMTGPLTRSFADLQASERSPASSPARTPAGNRSPVDRRPTIYSRSSLSNDSIPLLCPPSERDQSQRHALTRPPSPEPTREGPRRSSLAELVMAKSGDDIAMAKGGRFFQPSGTSPGATGSRDPNTPTAAWFAQAQRRESTDSVRSAASVPIFTSEPEQSGGSVPPRRRSAVALAAHDPRRQSFTVADDSEEGVEPKMSDPGMRGMEVLAESAHRVAEVERKNSGGSDDQPRESTPPKAATSSGPSTGPKYACAYCAKTFSRPSSLRIHTYSHTGERPFVCKEPSCRRRFSVQSNLKRHAKVHQMAAQQAQAAAQMNARPAGPPHLHPSGPAIRSQPQHVYGYPPHGQPPAHPHLAHPHPGQHHHAPQHPGYVGGPPYTGMPHMGAMFDPRVGPLHARDAAARGPHGEPMPPNFREGPTGLRPQYDMRRASSGGNGVASHGGSGDWSDEEEEVDELDEED